MRTWPNRLLRLSASLSAIAAHVGTVSSAASTDRALQQQSEDPARQDRAGEPAAILVTGERVRTSRWLRAESRNFIVYGSQGEADLREQVILLEQFDATLRIFTGITAPPPLNRLEIVFVPDASQLRRFSFETDGFIHNAREHDFEHGFYAAKPSGTLAVFSRAFAVQAGLGSTDDWLLHEYTHHFIAQHDPLGVYPAWYGEGFAEYMGASEIAGRLVEIGVAPVSARNFWLQHNWGASPDLLFRRDPHRLLASRSQAEPIGFLTRSWVLVHYLLSEPRRREALQAYLRSFRAEADPDAAFATAFGTAPANLQRDLRDYARRLSGRRFNLPSAPDRDDITVSTLPPSADRLLPLFMALKRGTSDPGLRRSILAQVRNAAAVRPDSFSRRVLALAEIEFGTPANADQPLAQLSAAAATDPELLYLQGMRRLAEARSGAPGERAEALRLARTWLTRALERDPDDYRILFRAAEAELLSTGEATENVVNMLLRAVQLAPQVSSVRISAALALLARGERTHVRELLATILNSTHNSAAPRALAAMSLFESGQRPSVEQLAAAFVAH